MKLSHDFLQFSAVINRGRFSSC